MIDPSSSTAQDELEWRKDGKELGDYSHGQDRKETSDYKVKNKAIALREASGDLRLLGHVASAAPAQRNREREAGEEDWKGRQEGLGADYHAVRKQRM